MTEKKPDISSDFDKAREEVHRQMLSAVSHDLKTPLATIIGSLEIFIRMENKLTPEKKSMLINSALSEGYRLDNFITNILDMAKLEGNMVKAKPEKCNITFLVQDCLTRIGPKKEKGKIILTPLSQDITVFTDSMLLGRCVSLLIENALKHAGSHPVIRIEYGVEDTQGCIQICDNGPGIPKGQEKAIFSKYTRLSKSDQQNAGTGLGLSICESIMKVLGGTVKTKNLPEGGAMFSLIFPAHLHKEI